MKMKEKELFEKREAVHYLVEDNELALIELNAKLKMQIKLLSFVNKFEGVEGDVDPYRFIDYLYRELHLKSLMEMEILREKSNRNYLKSKAEMLWQM